MRIYDSGPVSGLTPQAPIMISHNLGAEIMRGCGVTLLSVVSGVEGGFEICNPTPGVTRLAVMMTSFDSNSVTVEMDESCSYRGDVKLVVFN